MFFFRVHAGKIMRKCLHTNQIHFDFNSFFFHFGSKLATIERCVSCVLLINNQMKWKRNKKTQTKIVCIPSPCLCFFSSFPFYSSPDFKLQHRCYFNVAATVATLNVSHSIKMSLFTRNISLWCKCVCVCVCARREFVCVIYAEKTHKDANKVCVQLIGSSQNHRIFRLRLLLRLMDRPAT